MPTLSAQFGGRSNRGRPFLQDSDGLDPRIIYDILHNDIWAALKYLDHYEQDPETVARWRPRLLAALEEIKAKHLIYGRNFRARQRQKRIAADKRTCAVCGAAMAGRRADARCCSNKCRVRFNRQNRIAPLEKP